MEAKDQLKDVINHIIQGNTEGTTKSFHPYLQSKMGGHYAKMGGHYAKKEARERYSKNFSELNVDDSDESIVDETPPTAA